MVGEEVFNLISKERKRQREELCLIPSENYVSPAVRQALGSVLTNKYAEGYPGKRYYQGNKLVDEIETLAIDRAKKLFGVPRANVQPYSGSPANLAILASICRVGDSILSQHLSHGGHLSMGQKASMTSRYYRPFYYGLTKEGGINWQELAQKAKNHQPKIIFCGGTAYTKKFNFSKYARIADEIDAFFVADISHIAGLIAGGAHPSPARSAHLIMTTTHKTLRGPRGAMIMVTQKGLKKDPDLGQKIDQAVFPGLQGGPHENNVAALAVALEEVGSASFKKYAQRVVQNAKVLAKFLKREGFDLIGEGTQNHMIWVDLTSQGLDGWTVAWACEAAGIILNRQAIPFDPRPPYYPSGIRLGTPAITTRGMKEPQMRLIGDWICQVFGHIKEMDLKDIGSVDWQKNQQARRWFKERVFQNPVLKKIKREVKSLCQKFPIP